MVNLKIGEVISICFLLSLLVFGGVIVSKNPILTGFATWYGGQEIDKLKLDDTCSLDPSNYFAWKIENENDIEIEYYWEFKHSGENGINTALIGDSYFNTSTIDEKDKLEIYVNGTKNDNKKNNGEQCEILEPLETEPEPCVENWICGNWSECTEENQTRECSDLNICNTTIEVPVLIQNCTMPPEPEPEENETIEGQNETEQNETIVEKQESEPELEPVVEASSGGGGNGGSSSFTPDREIIMGSIKISAEEITANSLNENPTQETSTSIESQEQQSEQGFALIIGNTVRDFFEERGLDYRIGIIGSIIVLILISSGILGIRRYFLRKRLESANVVKAVKG